jgi:hypothetical protein
MFFYTYIPHSIDKTLWCSIQQHETHFDIYIRDQEQANMILIKFSSEGHYKSLYLDQNNTSIKWEQSTDDLSKYIPLLDCSRKEPPYSSFFSFSVGLANAIFDSRNFRSISKPFSKNIIGIWKSGDGELIVHDNGEYEFNDSLHSQRPFFDYPRKGAWEISKGFFYGLVDGTGKKRLLFSVDEKFCRFIGDGNYVYYELYREK